MRGLKKVSEDSKAAANFNEVMRINRNIYLPVYYSDDKDTVYTEPGRDRELVTHLINPCTPSEIKEIVTKWKWR